MGKYSRKKPKTRRKGMILLVAVLLTLLVAAVLFFRGPGKPGSGQQTETNLPETESLEPAPSTMEAEIPDTEPPETQPAYWDLGDGLRIEKIGDYAGMYMEDGSNEVVEGVMMILLSNLSENDLQLARIYLEYPDFTAEFEVTNLPAGECVVVQEKNRQQETGGKLLSVESKNVVFFPEAMSLQEDRISINAMNGVLEVTNISETDIPGPVYVYYKNSASGMLYGGITFRVTIREGLKAGETRTVNAGHYTKDNSRLLMVGCGE
jgi:hypothetical protein